MASSQCEPPEKRTKPDESIAKAYTTQDEGTYSAILIVEGVKLYVIKEILARFSSVFKAMFNGKWKEAKKKEVKLPGKSLQAVVWMLDYMYQHTNFYLHDAESLALLPLTMEYQIDCLQQKCVRYFESKTSPSRFSNTPPTLQMLTMAEHLGLQDLKEQMIINCAALIKDSEIDEQRALPENKTLSDETYNKLIRVRLRYYEQNRSQRFQPERLMFTETLGQIKPKC